MPGERRRVAAFCPLCVSRCGCEAVVENRRLVAIEPDPSHPTGKALCAKGRASPELVEASDRLLYPMRRTRPKGDPDPGWRRITWDEALNETATAMHRIAAESGPEAVAFTVTTSSGTAISDAGPWIDRLINAFGSPNNCNAMEICAWHRNYARAFTTGTAIGTPDYERAGCILLWGHNPSTSLLAAATKVADSRAKGAKLIVVDPRRIGFAVKADSWLRVRPGTDAAVALSIAGVMIDKGWFDAEFVRNWTNGPFLVRADDGTMLRSETLAQGGEAAGFVAWDESRQAPVAYDIGNRRYRESPDRLAISGEFVIATREGQIRCRPAFELFAARCRAMSPKKAAAVSGVEPEAVREAARLLWHHAHYAGDHVVSTHYLDNGDNNTLFFLFPVFLIVGLSYLFLRLDLLVVQLRQCHCHSAAIIISTTNIILPNHGLVTSPGSDESSNSISSTTAMGTAISR